MNGISNPSIPNPMVGLPTPAGHQAELNYIYGMVEELSRQLAENKRALEEVVSGVGRVRTRARQSNLSNEELLSSAADELAAQDAALDPLISLLTESLEKAKHSRDANLSLLAQYATALTTMLKSFHDYKSRHVADVSAWHRSYRSQLAEARAENCRLREQIWDMQAHAGKANESLRKLRKAYDEDRQRWESRVEQKALRQEVRFWKRMALEGILADGGEVGDVEFSDDDDLIDVAEKERLKRVAEDNEARMAATRAIVEAQERQQGQMVGDEGDLVEEGHGQEAFADALARMNQYRESGMNGAGQGGVPMQRDTSGNGGPVMPPRPGSAASSTGSTGQAQ